MVKMAKPSSQQNVWFPLEIQQLRKRCEFQESIVAAKIEYNLGNMNNCENQSNGPKLGTPKWLLKPLVFEEKSMLRLEDKTQAVLAYNYLRFFDDFDDNKG